MVYVGHKLGYHFAEISKVDSSSNSYRICCRCDDRCAFSTQNTSRKRFNGRIKSILSGTKTIIMRHFPQVSMREFSAERRQGCSIGNVFSLCLC